MTGIEKKNGAKIRDINDVTDNLVSDFELIESEFSPDEVTNPYIQSLFKASALHIVNDKRVRKALEDAGPVGLFHLFLTRQYLSVLAQWTSGRLLHHFNTSVSVAK